MVVPWSEFQLGKGPKRGSQSPLMSFARGSSDIEVMYFCWQVSGSVPGTITTIRSIKKREAIYLVASTYSTAVAVWCRSRSEGG